MSTPEKLRGASKGKPESELTRLKTAWRSLSEPARDFWRALFVSDTTQAQIRAQIITKLKIQLTRDNQLTEFRQWLFEQDLREQEAERQLADEAQILSDHPDWALDQAREEVLKRSYFRTLATGDFKLGLKTVKADQNERILDLDRQKFEFDAAKACLAKLPELKAISSNKTLSEPQKVEQIRLKLFGVTP